MGKVFTKIDFEEAKRILPEFGEVVSCSVGNFEKMLGRQVRIITIGNDYPVNKITWELETNNKSLIIRMGDVAQDNEFVEVQL